MAEMKIAITKAGSSLSVDLNNIPEEMYALALAEGLKSLLNAGMSKILTKGLEGKDLEAAKAAALAKATANLEKLTKGEYKKGRASGATDADGKKVSGPTMTEAVRLARVTVKDSIREAGMRPSMVAAADITIAAKELVKVDPSYIEQATKNLAERGKKPIAVDISSLIKESPKLVAKADAEKAKKKSTLSATQAGKVAPAKGSKPKASQPQA